MWLHTHLIQDMLSICRETFKGSVDYAWTSVPTYPRYLYSFIINFYFSFGLDSFWLSLSDSQKLLHDVWYNGGYNNVALCFSSCL